MLLPRIFMSVCQCVFPHLWLAQCTQWPGGEVCCYCLMWLAVESREVPAASKRASLALRPVNPRPLTTNETATSATTTTVSVIAHTHRHTFTHTDTHTHAHTHTHPFNDPLSGTTQVCRYQKGKTNLDFTEARHSEWQWHQLGLVQVCTSLQTDNHASTPPLSF